MTTKKQKEPVPKPKSEEEKFRVSSKVTSKWQITVPKAVREELGLRPGQDLVFIGTREHILVKRHVDLSGLDKWANYLTDLAGVDVDEMIEEMRGR